MKSSARLWTAVVTGVVVLISAWLVAGCGGAGSPQPASSDQTGGLVIKVDWPQASTSTAQGRYIPLEAKSIKAFVFVQGDLVTVQATDYVNLPGNSVTLTGVPVGPKDVRLTAYDGLGGAGTAVAWGVCQANVQWGQENLGHAYLEAYRLIFVTNRDGNYELYRATPDGRYANTRLTNNAVSDFFPAPSPDGNKIAYAANPGADYEIRLYDNTSGSITTFANLTGDDWCPAWSPDSKKIAWINHSAGLYLLKIKNADGSGSIASLSLGSGETSYPSWSPDGTRIAFSQHDGADYEIKMVRSDLSGSIWSVTNDSIQESYPIWSHDGATLYISARDTVGPWELAFLDGTSGFWPGNTYSPSFLTNEPWDHWLSDVSPDGNLLAYYCTSWEAGNSELYYLDIGPGAPVVGGSHQSIRVTYNPAGDSAPTFLRPGTASGSVGAE